MNEAIERNIISNDWITIILLVVIALLVYNKIRYQARFQSFQSIIYNNNYISNYAKATPVIFNTFNILFIVIDTIVISLLVFVVLSQQELKLATNDINNFLLILFYVFSFIVLRFIVGLFIAFLFEKEKEQQYFSFVKLSYLNHFSLLIFPLLIINFYIYNIYFTHFLLITAILLLLFYYFLQIKNNQKLVFNKMFYFILYLCALEISPLIIIYKLVIK